MKLSHFLWALALAACAPPGADAPAPTQEETSTRSAATGDCVAAAEAMHVQDAPQPACDWNALNASASADSFVGYYQSSRAGVDGALAVAPRSDGSYGVGVSTVFAESMHMCGGAFDGHSDGDALALTPRDAGAQACSVRLVRGEAPGEATMRADGDCSNFCGARATLDGVTFRRR